MTRRATLRRGTRKAARWLLVGAGLAAAGAALGGGTAGATDGNASTGATMVPACPSTNPPNELSLVGGTPQTTRLGAAFDDRFQVALGNTNGCPVTTAVAGTEVTFTAPASGPSGFFSSTGSAAATVGADAAGTADAPMFTANDSPGSYTVTAGSRYGSVSFSLTNTAAGIPASIVAVAPTSRSATVGARYAAPLQAQVLDANGNPVQGANVTFALGSSPDAAGATFDGGGAQADEATNAAGVATSPLLTANGVAGRFTATAATAGISEPASFALENLTGTPPKIARVGSRARSATVGTRYGRALQVKVTVGGRPLQGTSVTFTLGSTGGGSAGPEGAGASFVGGAAQAAATTTAAGVATSPRFDANATAGRFTATATIAGTAGAAAFSLDNLAAGPPMIRPVGIARRSAAVDTRYRRPLEVRVLDAHRKPLQGETVTFALGSDGGASGGSNGASSAGASFLGAAAQATATTNAAGIAISPRFEANSTAGRFTATATVAGSGGAAIFSLRNRAGTPATVTAGAAASESAPAGARFPIPLAVTVSDRDANPVAGASVLFSAPARGPSGTFTRRRVRTRAIRVRTNAAGIAVAPAFTANGQRGGYVVRATVRHAGAAAFALVNRPPGQP